MPLPSHADAERRADLAACSQILRKGSRSFHAASLLLPARVRAPATALYAFCRVADDAIDAGHDPRSLERLTARLDRAYARRPEPTAIDRAFAAVVSDKRIPRAIPDALLEGFAWDLAGRRYATLAELEAYAVRVAGTVGLMMALVMGVRTEAALARALDLGVAMQLTNIARDVGEDLRAGRLYLPLDWLAEVGMDPQALLASPRYSPALGRVTKRLLEAAERLYRRSEDGIAALPADCRPSISAAGKIYSAIGRRIALQHFDSVSCRAVVPSSAKLWRLVASLAAIAPARGGPSASPLETGRFLIAAVTAMGEPAETAKARFGDRVGGVAEAFARLERIAAPAEPG